MLRSTEILELIYYQDSITEDYLHYALNLGESVPAHPHLEQWHLEMVLGHWLDQ